MEDENKKLSKSMMNLSVSPKSPMELNNTTHESRFRIFSFRSRTGSTTPKKSAKKLMKQSKTGYGSYSNLFRAQSYDSLCVSSATMDEKKGK